MPVAHSVRAAALGALDAVEGALGRGDPLRPPRRLHHVGDGDFRAVGEALLEALIAVGGLDRDARVLDVGCGTGRTAVPLTGYLRDGSYDGFDISAPAIRWCQDTLTSRFPTFVFRALDIANSHYNPDGGLDASGIRFPYEPDAFDFAVATSVFTHMLPGGFLHYLDELARVLAPGGTFFGTFFLLDEDSLTALDRGRTLLELPTRHHDAAHRVDYRAMDARTPETGIALPAYFVLDGLGERGFEVSAVHPGLWSGHVDGALYQDIVVARRRLG
ncbi:MAG: class I SAM-dependent methyltransferase [Solirubrobacteraceae bacterium]